jgi:DNA-binding response OmpR family regulator
MEIIILYNEVSFKHNIDSLRNKVHASYQLLSLHQFEESYPRLNPDLFIYFHSIGSPLPLDTKTIQRIKLDKNKPICMVIPKSEQLLEHAFQHGVDEVIYHPYSLQEFAIRVEAILKRRLIRNQPVVKIISVHDLVLDTDNYQVKRGQTNIPITKLEFQILLTLASNTNKVFKKKDLYELIWQDHYYDNGNVLNVHIRRLRKKIEVDPDNPLIIQTKWGIGYTITK